MSNPQDNNAVGKTVVLIDDDIGTRERLALHLRGCGLVVEEFTSGMVAREFLISKTAHAVITDLRLPDFHGLELLQFVNQLELPIPVILMSGIGNVSDVAQALRLGAADYLIKPILDYDVVLHSVEHALNILVLKQENEAYKTRLEQVNRELTEHIQILERDQQAAKQVQSNLLPMTPVVYQGIELSHLVIPSLYLSGDFVDYGCLHQRYVAFYLTDVSGHGASSAFVTVWLKQLVRRLFRERQLFSVQKDFAQAPAELLEVINRELMQSRFFSHMTSIVGVIDTQTYQMNYVVAGHLPLPVLVAPDGTAAFLDGKGKPIGLFEDACWEVYNVTLPKGFQLLMFSDGILEVLPGAGVIEREAELLRRIQAAESINNVAELAERLGLDCSQEEPDDIAMAMLRDGAIA